jgi:hypothetical protein
MSAFKLGDIVGFSGANWQSDLLTLGTYGIPRHSLSHVGIVGEHEGRLTLVESTTEVESPCVVTGKIVRGVQAHWLHERIESYHGKVWHYPLVRDLYPHESRRLNKFLRWHLGCPYDDIGAFRAGGIGWSWIESRLHANSLASLFCSELCAAAHSDIGLFETSRPARWSPRRFVNAERKAGVLNTRRLVADNPKRMAA